MTDDQNDDQEPGRLRQIVEEANARAAAAESERDALKAKDVFRDAGVDPSNPLHAAVMKGYDGAMEPEAVKAFVSTVGLTQPPPQPQVEAPGVPQSEQDGLVRIAEAARDQGGPPPSPDRRAQLAQEMANLPKTASPAEYDRLAVEYTRAGGNRSTQDQPG